MIIKGNDNDFVALAQRLNIQLNLQGQHLIFDCEKDLMEHHNN